MFRRFGSCFRLSWAVIAGVLGMVLGIPVFSVV